MSERERVIKSLQQKAEQVLAIKKEHRQKRPIVIEFSGSPKAGKTSSINSLAIFLKRNGFSVLTIEERASICPVSDKQSPMFNFWTACSSVAQMIGALEDNRNKIDVLILDRGIFDALCWFEWLVNTGKMEERQKKAAEEFFLLQEFVKPIDIVFSFTVDPETSIKREYANLLTDKLGSIMNKRVLGEYLEAIRKTVNGKRQYFHDIIEINTTDKEQDDVGKDVTIKTLDSLRNLLMERIGYFKPNKGLMDVLQDGIVEYDRVKSFLPKVEFELRDDVEANPELLQPLPIAVIMNKEKNKVLVIRKNKNSTSSDSPERDRNLLYVGGHTRFEDQTGNTHGDFLDLCKSTLRREIKEEIGISVAVEKTSPFFIYNRENNKSIQHMAVCFPIVIDEDIKLRLDATELVRNKGRSKSGHFIDVGELAGYDLEAWSTSILKRCFGIEKSENDENESQQITLEEYLQLKNMNENFD